MVHPRGFVNSRRHPASLGFCEFAVGTQWCTLGVLVIRGGTPMVHPWGFVNSRWDPNGLPLGFYEFAVKQMVHPWGFVNSRWDPNGAPLGFCDFATCNPLVSPKGLRLWRLVSPLVPQRVATFAAYKPLGPPKGLRLVHALWVCYL